MNAVSDNVTDSTWHPGEVALQRLAGVDARLAQMGPHIVRDHMPAQHREFFAQLPFIVAGTVDEGGQPWASVLAGPPGFIASPNAGQLLLQAQPLAHDVLNQTLKPGAPVGLLGIEAHTRRRNRANGLVRGADAGGFTIDVLQSFGNCPKYIQPRRAEFAPPLSQQPVVERGRGLIEAARKTVRAADTFFIATAHPQALADGDRSHGVDVSHRGGLAGFVQADGDTLTVPDYVGNYFFNTLGNLLLRPACGLLFIDFDTGALVSIAARAGIVTDPAQVRLFEGAQRLLRFDVTSSQCVQHTLPLRWR